MLDLVAIQEREDSKIWRELGVSADDIHHTGSLKLDPGSGARPKPRPEFQQMLDQHDSSRHVILAASTHSGEDAWIAHAIREASPNALIAIVPRHAERRSSVKNELERAGFKTVLRSRSDPSRLPAEPADVLLIDTTGELRDWTAHADLVIIGKSFLATGGQNPSEAILANKPVVFGPNMQNFEPLASRLVDVKGALRAHTQTELANAITQALNPATASMMTKQASMLLRTHEGATQRIVDLLSS